MKKLPIFFILLVVPLLSKAQSDSSSWSFNTEINFYLIPDDFIILPVFRADKNRLHLEARYNYEDYETFSGWFGYNFMGGKKVEYIITPMVGGVAGLSNGIAPGLEFTFTYKGFEIYSESEYLFDLKTSENNFLYSWTDVSWSPKDWLWFGLSGQRTRLYQTDLDIQRGLLIGGGLKQWELTSYLYNIGFDDPFVLISLSVGF
ncbi:MAG: hypothetical protein IPK96_01915 [Flammeovirgaceae bacterium]|jgi:hypothetical protein|nr:hypothetical protein [Flammeovirgaceae bacterium]